MTGFLASVTSADEAALAFEAGADLIDLKDPTAGALGALPSATVRTAVARIAGRRKTSATTGDLPMVPDEVLASAARLAETGVDFVKVGIFPGGDLPATLSALSGLAEAGVRLVAVLLADRDPDFDLIEPLRAHGFAGAMLDTADKSGGRLGDHLDAPTLERFVVRARGAGLMVGLAGSLRLEDIAPLLLHRPDYLGFRGALCAGDRKQALDPEAIRAVRQAIPVHGPDVPSASAAAGAQRAAQSAV